MLPSIALGRRITNTQISPAAGQVINARDVELTRPPLIIESCEPVISPSSAQSTRDYLPARTFRGTKNCITNMT